MACYRSTSPKSSSAALGTIIPSKLPARILTLNSAAYCQIYDSIFLDLPMSRVNFNARAEYQYLDNFKILQNAFRKHHVDRPLATEQLCKCKMQDNLEFLQWTKRYWDQYYPGGDYDAVGRRKGAPAPASGGPPPTSARTSTTSASANTGARRPAGGAGAAPRATSRQAGAGGGGGGAASTLLQSKNAELMETVMGLERERDFYFSKLRDIELLIQQAMEADPALEEDEGSLLKQIQTILYSTEVSARQHASLVRGIQVRRFEFADFRCVYRRASRYPLRRKARLLRARKRRFKQEG